MKRIKVCYLAVLAGLVASVASATNSWDGLVTTATGNITDIGSDVVLLLGAMLGIWACYLIYRLIRRTWGR